MTNPPSLPKIAKFIVTGAAALLMLWGAKLVLFPATVANLVVNSATGVIAKTVDASNVLSSYEWFFDTRAQFDARAGQIRTHHQLADAELIPEEHRRLNLELSAMRQSCRELASRYNANSVKANKALFKDRELPTTLPLTTCES